MPGIVPQKRDRHRQKAELTATAADKGFSVFGAAEHTASKRPLYYASAWCPFASPEMRSAWAKGFLQAYVWRTRIRFIGGPFHDQVHEVLPGVCRIDAAHPEFGGMVITYIIKACMDETFMVNADVPETITSRMMRKRVRDARQDSH